MNITKEILEILKNFSQIKSSINFVAGNVIKTKNEDASFYASSEIAENFPIDFSIYDLSQFIRALSLFDESEIEFKDTHMVIKNKNGKGKINYTYTNPIMISSAVDYTKNPKFKNLVCEFELSNETFKQLLKAGQVFGIETLIFKAKDQANIEAVVANLDNNKKDTDNSFSTQIAIQNASEEIKTLNISTDKNIFKIIPGDYLVKLYNVNDKIYMLEMINKGDTKLTYYAGAKVV